MATSRGNTTGRAAASGNIYYKNSGVKVTVPARNVNTKQTRAGEAAMSKAQDTGRGRGPLRGVARRAREGADLENTKKYPSQDVVKKSTKATTRLKGKITDGKITPTPETPVKRSTTGKGRQVGGINGPGANKVNPVYRNVGGAGLGGMFGIKNR